MTMLQVQTHVCWVLVVFVDLAELDSKRKHVCASETQLEVTHECPVPFANCACHELMREGREYLFLLLLYHMSHGGVFRAARGSFYAPSNSVAESARRLSGLITAYVTFHCGTRDT